MEMTDTIMLLASLASFGVLLIGWMVMPTDVATEETAKKAAMPAARTA
jgi:hypothetical protein